MLPKILSENTDPEEYVRKYSFTVISSEVELKNIIEEVFRENEKAVKDALKNPKAINYLVGAVMKKTRGRADPKTVIKLIQKYLEELRSKQAQ